MVKYQKDWLEQVRTVHIALVAVAITLLVLVTGHNRSTLVSAISQIDELIAASNTWKAFWFVDEVRAALAEEQAKRKGRLEDAPLVPTKYLLFEDTWGKSHVIKVLISGDQWQIFHRGQKTSFDWMNRSAYPPKSVREWKEFWNRIEGASELHSHVHPSTHIWVRDSIGPLIGKWSEQGAATEHLDLTLRDHKILRVFNFEEDDSDDRISNDVYLGVLQRIGTGKPVPHIGDDGVIVVEGESPTISELNLQQFFIKSHPHWSPGKFDDSFYDLDQASKGLDDLDLTRARSLLRSAELAAPEAVEAFGLKLPAVSAAIWGPVFILGVQLYFLLLLREPIISLGATEDVAWVGVYRSWMARVATAASSGILPLGTVLACDVRGWNTLDPGLMLRLWLGISAFIGFILAAFSVLAIKSLFENNNVIETIGASAESSEIKTEAEQSPLIED